MLTSSTLWSSLSLDWPLNAPPLLERRCHRAIHLQGDAATLYVVFFHSRVRLISPNEQWWNRNMLLVKKITKRRWNKDRSTKGWYDCSSGSYMSWMRWCSAEHSFVVTRQGAVESPVRPTLLNLYRQGALCADTEVLVSINGACHEAFQTLTWMNDVLAVEQSIAW